MTILLVDVRTHKYEIVTNIPQKELVTGVGGDFDAAGKEAMEAYMAMDMRDGMRDFLNLDTLPDRMRGLDTIVTEYKNSAGRWFRARFIAKRRNDKGEVQEAREAGVTAFVAKPIFMSELRLVLSKRESEIGGDGRSDEKKYDYRGKRVLLVEDNDLNREIAVAILEGTGMTVDSVSDGTEAVNIMHEVDEDTYDLIFMDIQMPLMDGYTATREIRTLSNNKKANIPIVAMTANAFDEDKRKSFEAGMNGHISKPINIEDIAKVLDQVWK